MYDSTDRLINFKFLWASPAVFITYENCLQNMRTFAVNLYNPHESSEDDLGMLCLAILLYYVLEAKNTSCMVHKSMQEYLNSNNG